MIRCSTWSCLAFFSSHFWNNRNWIVVDGWMEKVLYFDLVHSVVVIGWFIVNQKFATAPTYDFRFTGHCVALCFHIVCLCVCPCVPISDVLAISTACLDGCYHIFASRASWDKDELFRFWGQSVKGQVTADVGMQSSTLCDTASSSKHPVMELCSRLGGKVHQKLNF